MFNARITDMVVGTCSCHLPLPPIPMVGMIVSCSADRTVENLGQARLLDLVLGSCGHTGIIASSSSSCTTNNIGNARTGDIVSGCIIGVISGGASSCTTGG